MVSVKHMSKIVEKPAHSCNLAEEPSTGFVIVHCVTQRGFKMHGSRTG